MRNKFFKTEKINSVGTEIKLELIEFARKLQRNILNSMPFNNIYFKIESDIEDETPFVQVLDDGLSSTKYFIIMPISFIESYLKRYDDQQKALRELNKIVAHEMLHIRLNHFSKEYNGYDPKLLNIAGDLVINEMLDIRYPGLRPDTFNYPKGLTTKEYYQLLDRDLGSDGDKDQTDYSESQKDGESQKTQNIQQNGNKDLIQKILDNMKDKKIVQYVGKNQSDIKKQTASWYDENPDYLLSMIQGTESANHQLYPIENYNTEEYDDNEEFKRFRDILKKSEGYFSRMKPVRSADTYYKMNRRHDSSVVLPGKHKISGGFEERIEKTSVLFCDFSGSIYSIINPYAKMIKDIEQYTNIMTVGYDTKMLGEFEPNKYVFEPNGGTSLNDSVKDFEDKSGRKLDKFYVFTDGIDNSILHVMEKYENSHIFIYTGGKIIEIETIDQMKKILQERASYWS